MREDEGKGELEDTRGLEVRIEAAGRLSKAPPTPSWKLRALDTNPQTAVLGDFGRRGSGRDMGRSKRRTCVAVRGGEVAGTLLSLVIRCQCDVALNELVRVS
jgi:hypothetical protein